MCGPGSAWLGFGFGWLFLLHPGALDKGTLRLASQGFTRAIWCLCSDASHFTISRSI